jgi:ankyrin repeat protein
MEETLVPWSTTYHPKDVADTRQGCERIYFRLKPLDPEFDTDGERGSSALTHAIMSRNLTANNLLHWRDQEVKQGPFLRWTMPRSERLQLDADSLLRFSCKCGDINIAQKALDRGAKINGCFGLAPGGPYDPPLCIAAKENHSELVSMLIDNKAQVMRPNLLQLTPLIIAVQRGFLETVEVLLIKGKSKISKLSPSGFTPLMMACTRGYEEMVRLLLKCGSALELATPFGEAALCAACRRGHVEIVNILLLRQVDICCKLREEKKKTCCLPIHEACTNGNVNIIREVIKRTMKNDEDNSLSLEYSKLKDHMLMCTQMNGSSPLCLASKNGHVKAVAAIFSLISKEMHERMLELVDQVEKRTPLLWAAANGKTSVFLFLLKCGANYLKRDKMGEDVWTLASDGGHGDILVVLEEFKEQVAMNKRLALEEKERSASRGSSRSSSRRSHSRGTR